MANPFKQADESKKTAVKAEAEEKTPAKKTSKKSNTLIFTVPKKPVKNSHTYYLSDDVVDELKSRSAQSGISPSEYLDLVLKSVFEI